MKEEKNVEQKEVENDNNNKINDTKAINEQEKLKNNINKKKKEEVKKEEEAKEKDEIQVEDTKDTKKTNNLTSSNNSNNYNNNNNFNANTSKFNQENINQARNQINNMSDEQINFMIQQMKNMDNQTLKNMMSSQGMNLSDQQIEMMKMSLTPETFKMLKDPNFNPPNMVNPINNNININTNNNINNNQSGNNAPQQMPNLSNMDFQQMMDYIKKNPELLKIISPQLSQMMGDKNIDPEIIMKSMEKIMWIFSIPGRIKRFILSWKGICFIILIIAIFYGLFKRK